ncbi:hypothetical protein LNQ49_17690 [Flavobacterium sp. F-65]|uniref:Uncharacterized protein n=1 Tax=Flavobacterium pisciphilum TaxID=2893755 RepID=A0ABS8MXA6_9FLAO|nr:hypothetical protein [Flavobacterium sp. F-65]MCC9073411.1 hypothetical protein [Flavobacterium sp. F-65]
MKKLIIGIALISIVFSCKDSKEIKTAKATEVVVKAVSKDSVKQNEVVSDEDFKSDFDILLPRSYRSYGAENPAASLTEKWIDLYEQNGEYYLGKADFKTEKGFDECSGDSLISIISKNRTIIFMDYPGLKFGKIKSLKIEKNKVWPKEKATYLFNNVSYTLRAEGKVLSSSMVHTDDDKQEVFKEVENYKLYLTTGNTKEQLLLTEESFNDTFVVLLFAGDIDGDGKLDFVFGANRHYEEERVILFLSSKAKNGEAVKKVSEVAIGFDC